MKSWILLVLLMTAGCSIKYEDTPSTKPMLLVTCFSDNAVVLTSLTKHVEFNSYGWEFTDNATGSHIITNARCILTK